MTSIEARDLHQRRLAGERLVLLDIRENDEVAYCQIPESLHIPMEELPQRLYELDRNAEIVVYCHAGVRSAYVCKFLAAQGFARVMNLRGGIMQWALQVDPDMAMY